MSEENSTAAPDADAVDRLARVYLLRLYRESLAAKRSLRSWLKDREPLAHALGRAEETIAKWGASRLAQAVACELARSDSSADGGTLAAALRDFAAEIGLSANEREVLQFAIVVSRSATLGRLAPSQLAGNCTTFHSMVAVATGLDAQATRDALAPRGRLVLAGLLRPNPGILGSDDLSERLELLDGVAEAFVDGRTAALFQDKLARTPAAAIALEDASYLRDELATAIAVLRGALETGARGIQILLHGEPGVGKTELARLIGHETGAPVFNVPDCKEAGDPMSAEQRLRHFALLQRLLLRKRRTVLIFDEIEDTLASPESEDWSGKPPVGIRKAWKNRLLEETEVPSIWIANWLDAVDPALLRRFTLAIKVPRPSVKARRAMLDRHAGNLDERVRAAVAEQEDITPADIARARRATELARSSLTESTDECFLRVLAMRAGRGGGRVRIRSGSPELPFRIEWLNTDPPVGDVVRLLHASGRGRLCFSGPPGTGKTALAQHLARALDRPLHSKKASDLLSSWLGETEKNIADAFEAAEREGAVLLIDEADTFLRGREYAVRSWEASQVNQLLKELEAFQGIVALCTNSFEILDRAVLRRLDLKVAFDRLPAAAAREAFVAAAATLRIEAAEAESVIASRPLSTGEFALGDVAVAVRQALLRAAVPSATLLRECLEGERRARLGREGRQIGFTA